MVKFIIHFFFLFSVGCFMVEFRDQLLCIVIYIVLTNPYTCVKK